MLLQTLLESFNKFMIFVFPFYMTLTEFCKKLKVVSFDFSMMKNIVAPLSSSSLPIKLIYYFKSGFFNSVCLLKSIAINL